MLAQNYDLVNVVHTVTERCNGKAYFTTLQTLGRYLFINYMNRSTKLRGRP